MQKCGRLRFQTRAAAAFFAVLCLFACSKREPFENCPEIDSARPVDTVLMSFLSRARAAHHAADAKETDKDLVGAVAALEQLLTGPIPDGPAGKPPEVREVLSDTRARLADLRSQVGAYDAALRDVDEGLGLAVEPSYFRGHLFEVRGLVEERRAKSLESTQPEAAKSGRQRALEAFEEAMSIQAEVIRKVAPLDASH